MSSSPTVQDRNRDLARQINDEARRNPNSLYAGKFVGLANGQVAVVGDDLDKVVRSLSQIEPDPQKVFCLDAGLDYDEVQEIWSVH